MFSWGIRSFIFSALLFSILSFSKSLLATQPAARAGTYETSVCGAASTQGISYKYCITPTNRTKNPDVLYYFHFTWGSETSYDKYFRYATNQEYAKYGVTPPTVVAISFGHDWFLNQSIKRDLHTLFVDQLMPILEKKVVAPKNKYEKVIPLGERHLLGQSMGGFNVAMLFLKNGTLFSRVAFQCPALPTLLPTATPAEIEAYIQRTGADPKYVMEIIERVGKNFPDQKSLDNHNPHLLAQINDLNPKSQVYVSCGEKDEYGLIEGSKLFNDIVSARGIKTMWVPIPGGKHCAGDPVSTIKFLALGITE